MNTYLDATFVFLSWAYKDGEVVTNLKMQKLLFYAQAWHLVFFNKPLFKESIEAWDLGPVIPEAYREFKSFGNDGLSYELDGNEHEVFGKNQLEFLSKCYSTFVRFSAHELVNMTHGERPWKDAYRKGNSTIISHDSMKDFYSKLRTKN